MWKAVFLLALLSLRPPGVAQDHPGTLVKMTTAGSWDIRPSLSFSLTQFVLKFLNRRQGAFQFFRKRGGKLIFGDADRF
jgi:hypothetical protein